MPQPISQTDLVAALNSQDMGALNISSIKEAVSASSFNADQGENFDRGSYVATPMFADDIIGVTMERPAPTPAPDTPGMG